MLVLRVLLFSVTFDGLTFESVTFQSVSLSVVPQDWSQKCNAANHMDLLLCHVGTDSHKMAYI